MNPVPSAQRRRYLPALLQTRPISPRYVPYSGIKPRSTLYKRAMVTFLDFTGLHIEKEKKIRT